MRKAIVQGQRRKHHHEHLHGYIYEILMSIGIFLRKNVVMTVAFIAAFITSMIVLPDAKYLSYFDFKTLTCLFCVLAVVCALKNVNFFYIIAQKIVRLFGNIKVCILALVYITFIGSMLIANDMALLTFLPLGYFVLSSTGKTKHMAFTFIMQNIAANLGGMLTPFGNPQNLYLYSKFSIPTLEFMQIMALPFIAAIALITVCCLCVKSEQLQLQGEIQKMNWKKTSVYLVLFALSILIVFKGIPYWIGLIIIPITLYFIDKKALKDVDYPLLFTFVFFFIFAGNMARIDAVNTFISGILNKDVLLVSIFSCQFMSNVPSAILLSQFTENYSSLLVGVNIGGAGTLIASLASLITFREYSKHNPDKKKSYIILFSLFNFGFVIVLTIIMKLFGNT